MSGCVHPGVCAFNSIFSDAKAASAELLNRDFNRPDYDLCSQWNRVGIYCLLILTSRCDTSGKMSDSMNSGSQSSVGLVRPIPVSQSGIRLSLKGEFGN